MEPTFIKYPLSNGFIDNWLVAGPLARPSAQAPSPAQAAPGSGVTEPVVDYGPLGALTEEKETLRWRYTHVRADHLVNFTASHPAATTLRAWAYARLRVTAAQAVRLALTSYGPAEIWLNGQSAGRWDGGATQKLHTQVFPAELQAGDNEILIHFEASGIGAVPYAAALQVQGLAETGAEVVLPTNIDEKLIEKRQGLETLIDGAIIERYVYGYLGGDTYDRNEPIGLRFAENLTVEGEMSWRLESLKSDIFQEGTKVLGPGSKVDMARRFPLRNGAHILALSPTRGDFYEKLLRFERKELFYVARSPYGLTPDPQPVERRQQALEDAAKRRNESIYVELAKMALGQWDKVERKIIDRAVAGIEQSRNGSVADLLGLLGAALRHKKKQPLIRDLRKSLQAAAGKFLFSAEDAAEVAVIEGIDFDGESRQILFYASEILAGQAFPAAVFGPTGKDGDWHQARGEERAIAWMKARGRYGFREWNSPAGTEAAVAALSHLADLASSDTVRELASVLLDKIFFSLAANSFRGGYGGASGASDTGSVISPRLQPTSGINRLLWGTGNINEHLLGTVSLATCKEYGLPSVIYRIAAEPDKAVWSQERHVAAGEGEQWADEAVIASFKTPDYLLACAQDYRPGQPGRAEHIWQATLGADAVVFVNHPSNMSENDSHRPNLWAGNGVLPKAAQWGDLLIAAYKLPDDDWLGFTHAYFPGKAFDEYEVDEKWAFARKGQGYVALAASGGLDYIWTGQTAGRELRSPGLQNVWLCHMGQQSLDGTFEEFQKKIKAMDLAFDGLTVKLQSLRGEAIEFGWDSPMLINGAAQPLAASRHIESPYCVADLPAVQMEIVHGGSGVRLKFE